MANVKVCLKCKHKTAYEDTAPIACEACGAIYRKVEEALRSGTPSQHPGQSANPTPYKPAAPFAARPFKRETPIVEFVEIMRAESLYPTWRELVKWSTWLGYAIALLLLVLSGFAFKAGSINAGIGIIVGAIVVGIMARVWRELSLMVADLADAAVRTAASRD